MKSKDRTRQPSLETAQRKRGDEKGYFLLVLNTHMPYVRNYTQAETEEENWLYEALTESYLPLLEVFDQLARDAVPFGVTLSLSPCLLDMLEDDVIRTRYRQYLADRMGLSRLEMERLKDQPHLCYLAGQNYERFAHLSRLFEGWQGDLVQVFRSLAATGCLALMTSSATHALLPLWQPYPHMVDFQVLVGVQKYEKAFGSKPLGFWLPECAYFPGLDAALARCGIKFFFLETHGICHAYPRPVYDIYAPVHCPAGVAAFGRDWFSHNQVWSKEMGYPGDPNYFDVHRDIGYELDHKTLVPFIHQDHPVKTGMGYHSIGGWLYHPDTANWRADVHAQDFLWKCQGEVHRLHGELGGKKPALVAAIDTEHFGHWWREGPRWLDLTIRKMACDQKDVMIASAVDYLRTNPTNQVATPSASSWGYRGYYEVWLYGKNHWVYPALFTAIEQFDDLLNDYPDPTTDEKAAFQLYLRELMLAQNSDLGYILHTGTFKEYAERRINTHLENMRLIVQQVCQGRIDTSWLLEMGMQDDIFKDMDLLSLYREARARTLG